MKKLLVLSGLLVLLSLTGCATMSPDDIKNIPVFDKIYYVIFEGTPTISDPDIRYGETLTIGRVLDQKPGGNNLLVARISIPPAYTDIIKKSTVFYANDGKLYYDTVGESSEVLPEGGKILGFTGKTGLYWFKTKNKLKTTSDTVINKAQELYNSATTGGTPSN